MPSSSDAQIVVVVSAESTVDSLSFKEVQKIFKGQPIKKTGETPCQVLEFAPSSDAFYNKLYRLDAYTMGKHWLRMIFSGERVVPPKNFSNPKKLLKFLSTREQAIGFITATHYLEMKDESIRTVVIDGTRFNQAQYPFQE